jgi:cell division protein FtsL
MSVQSSQVRTGRPTLRVVRRSSPRLLLRGSTRRLTSYVVASTIVVLAVVFGVLLEQVVLAQSAFKLKGIQDQLVKAETRHKELMLEAARLESSERIERFARGELGMIKPDAQSVSYIQADVRPRIGGRMAQEGSEVSEDVAGTAAGAP